MNTETINKPGTTTPAKTGRPTKLTPELQEKICRYIAAGNYLTTSCQAVGINDVTFNNWLKLGVLEENNGGGMYFDFLDAVKRAEAEQEAKLAERLVAGAMPGERKRVTKTGPEGETVEVTETGGDWLAAATYLERRHRERWGRPAPIQVQVNETKEIHITHVEICFGESARPAGEVIEGEARELLPNGENREEPTP